MKKPIRCEKAKSLTSSNTYIDTPINSRKFALVIGHLGIMELTATIYLSDDQTKAFLWITQSPEF